MPAVDSVVAVLLLLRARSGYRRGFVAQALDLSGFGLAVFLAFRFYCVLARPFRRLGVSLGWSSVAGALLAFVPAIVAVAIVGWKLGKFTRQPGLNMTNRVLGAALAVAIAGVGLVFVQLLLELSPIPDAHLLDRSRVASALLRAVSPITGTLEAAARAALPGARCVGG